MSRSSHTYKKKKGMGHVSRNSRRARESFGEDRGPEEPRRVSEHVRGGRRTMEATILEIERRGRTGNRRSSRRRAGSSSRVGEDTEPKYSKEPRDALPKMVERKGPARPFIQRDVSAVGFKCCGVQVQRGVCAVGCMCSRV